MNTCHIFYPFLILVCWSFSYWFLGTLNILRILFVMGDRIGLLGLPWQNTTDEVASTTEICFLMVLEPEVQDQGVGSFVSSWDLSPWLADGRLLTGSSQGLSSVHTHPRCSLCFPISSFYKDTSQIGLGPTLMALLELNHLLKGPISKYGHSLGHWR